MYNNILTYLIFIPITGSALMLLVSVFRKENNDSLYKWIALASTGIQLLLTIVLFMNYDANAGMQFEEKYGHLDF